MTKLPTATFQDFIKIFPKVELPVVLSEESQTVFSKENKPLPKVMIEQFIIPIEEEIDEFTEYVPCFRMPNTGKFHAIIFWKAGLLNYEYLLASFDRSGNLIEKKVIAGTQLKGDALLRTVATIEENGMITCVVGVASTKDALAYDPATTLDFTLQLQNDGTILT